jgi:acyl carrier protein
MIEAAEVEGLILKALEHLNEELPPGKQIAVRPDTPLFGVDSQLDSLSLVSLVVEVELAINTRLGLDLSLADERAMSRPVLPFTSVRTLRDYILELTSGR